MREYEEASEAHSIRGVMKKESGTVAEIGVGIVGQLGFKETRELVSSHRIVQDVLAGD